MAAMRFTAPNFLPSGLRAVTSKMSSNSVTFADVDIVVV